MGDDDAVLRAVGARLRRLRHDAGLTLSRAYRVPIGELVDAPGVGDPRVHLRPVRRFGLTFVPLTRQAGGVQAYKVLYPPAATLPPPELRAGEAAEFDTRTPHWIGNPDDDRPAEVIAVFGTQGERVHLHDT